MKQANEEKEKEKEGDEVEKDKKRSFKGTKKEGEEERESVILASAQNCHLAFVMTPLRVLIFLTRSGE